MTFVEEHAKHVNLTQYACSCQKHVPQRISAVPFTDLLCIIYLSTPLLLSMVVNFQILAYFSYNIS